jgi:hypothetical protein
MRVSIKHPAALLSFALGVSADVWAPPVITPNKATVWCMGSKVTATWYVLRVSELEHGAANW